MKLDEVKVLISLGLTLNQSKIFLALANSGPATVQKISEVTKIARETIYRDLPKLYEQGLVLKVITKPAIFVNTPLEEGFSILLEKKTKQVSELRNLKQIFLKNFKKTPMNNKQQNASIETVFIPQKKPLYLEAQKSIKKAREILSVLGSRIKISQAMILFKKELKRAMDRGVRVHIITEKFKDKKLKSNILIKNELIKEPLLAIRYSSDRLPAHVLLVDGKQVIINTNIRTELMESPAVLSTNHCIVDLAQKYFDLMWQKAEQEHVLAWT